MPNYRIVITNVADHAARSPLQIGHSQVELCTAPDEATVRAMIHRDISRYTDPALYTYTIHTLPHTE